MIAVSLDNLLFFLLIAAAALFQLLSKAVSKASKNQSEKTVTSPTPQRPPPIRRVQKESDADRIRKFLEALGQPPGSSPPPPVASRTDVPPRPLAPVQPSPVIPHAWGLSREQRTKPDIARRDSLPPEQPRYEIVPPTAPAPVAPVFEVREATLPIELHKPPIFKAPLEASAAATRPFAKGADFKTDIASLLATKSGLREAIILREIFGSPRGLQELDLL